MERRSWRSWRSLQVIKHCGSGVSFDYIRPWPGDTLLVNVIVYTLYSFGSWLVLNVSLFVSSTTPKIADGLCTKLIKPKVEEGDSCCSGYIFQGWGSVSSHCDISAFLTIRSMFGPALSELLVVFSLTDQQAAGQWTGRNSNYIRLLEKENSEASSRSNLYLFLHCDRSDPVLYYCLHVAEITNILLTRTNASSEPRIGNWAVVRGWMKI